MVIAPDSAPKNKVDKMRHETFGFDKARAPCTVLPVPYERWWRVVETGDPMEELKKGGVVQSLTKRLVRGCENFVLALA